MLEATRLKTVILWMRPLKGVAGYRTINWTNKEQLTSNRDLPVFPNSGSGGGPEMPSFLNTDNGATQYLGEKEWVS